MARFSVEASMGSRNHLYCMRSVALAAIFAAALLAVPARAQTSPAEAGKQLTLERIFAKPSLSSSLTERVEWSPDGKRLSFFQETGPGKELWVIEPATGERRRLVDAKTLAALMPSEHEPPTQRTGLGRVHPKPYFWAPGGEALLFASKTALVWYDLKTQTARTLVRGTAELADPKISPDGRWVSFVRDYDLWAESVATGEQHALTHGGAEELRNGALDWVYPEELSIHTAYWWSPDSKQVAYLQMDERPVTRYPLLDPDSYSGEIHWMRYPKAGGANPIVRVGVVEAGGGAPRWIDTGDDTDIYLARVDWLRDSKQLAIQRLNRAQDRLELLLANPSTGRAHVLLTEQDKFWVDVSDELYFFTDGKRFLWSSERSGFRHLYLYDLSGRLTRQLTRGDWEITALDGVDETNGLLYFTATEKSPLERNLYRISLEGGAPARLTATDGDHAIQMAPGCGAFVDTYSTAMTPPRQDLDRADGSRVLALNDNPVAELADYHLSPIEFFTLPGDDGTPLNAMMIKPPDFDPARKYPVLVTVYGGPGAQTVRNQWGGSQFLWRQMMAQKGYLMFAVDNRGSAGRGHVFETPLFHHFGAVELADQLAGVRYLRSLAYVDSMRIGIWGWSYGGHMTLQAMFRAAGTYKAGLAVAPVTDWRQYDTIYTERYMGTPQENPEGYKNSSPVNYAERLQGKLLVAHGTGDDNVNFANTLELVDRLILAGHYAEVMLFPGRGHPISDRPAQLELFRRATQFFLDNL
jgi:dipeptidyl-peptidase-4